MADLATPSAAAMTTMDASAETAAPSLEVKQHAVKPEKPDEGVFKAALEKARKALTDAQASTVRLVFRSYMQSAGTATRVEQFQSEPMLMPS